jgi:hypothetical protein
VKAIAGNNATRHAGVRAVELRSVLISADIRRSRTLRSVCDTRAQREATHKYLSLVRAENAAGNVPLI